MNRLVLAFGIVCLLQGLSAAPRPEYGLSVSIKNSDKISAVSDRISDILGDINSIPLPTLTAGYGKYESTLSAIGSLIIDIDGLINPILEAYSDLVADTTGNVDLAFTPFLSAINDASAYLTGSDITAYLATLTTNGYIGIVDQINDEGERLTSGLAALTSAVETVKNKINAAYTEAGDTADVPAAILNANLKLSDMYAFLTAANDLKAFLPLLDYILYTVSENLAEGDDYISSLQELIDDESGNASQDYQDELDVIIESIEGTVAAGFESIFNAYDSIYTAFGSLALSGASDYGSLDTTVMSFVSAFDAMINIDDLNTSLGEAFDEIGTELDALITALTASFSVVDNDLVILLVDTLIGNLEYGEYCYYKYKDLVENLLTAGLDGGWECVDKEYLRLQHLENTIILLLDLLLFDFEFMEAELNVCDSLVDDADNLDGCVSELNTYYSNLLIATTGKRDLVYDLAEAEAEASKNRLLICFELVYIDTSVAQAAAITTGLTECAANGPNGSD